MSFFSKKTSNVEFPPSLSGNPRGKNEIGFAKGKMYNSGGFKAIRGDCIRVAYIKLRGWQYYSLTALIFSPTSRKSVGV